MDNLPEIVKYLFAALGGGAGFRGIQFLLDLRNSNDNRINNVIEQITKENERLIRRNEKLESDIDKKDAEYNALFDIHRDLKEWRDLYSTEIKEFLKKKQNESDNN